MIRKRVTAVLFCLSLVLLTLNAADPPPPTITEITRTNSQVNLRFAPYPAAQSYSVLSAPDAGGPFAPNPNFILSPYISSVLGGRTNYGYEWRWNNSTAPSTFFQVQVTPMSSNALLASTVLNRLAYGPTPDELERVNAIGPQAYIDEQLNMNGIPETMDAYIVHATNAIHDASLTNWTYISVTGRLSGTTFYLFLTQPGEVYVDDVRLVEGSVAGAGPNLIANGDFETTLSPPWTLAGGAAGSTAVTGVARSGSRSLRLVSTAAGSTSGNNVRQTLTTSLTNNTPVTLSYWYLPNPNSSRLRVQLSGSGMISSAANIPPPPRWIYATATGPADSINRIYLYLSGAGECYIDDLKLVPGSIPEAGPNLLQNGDFESALTGPWQLTADFTNSVISTNIARSGNGSLRLIATAAGGGSGDSVFQTVPGVTAGQIYTVSYWYLPATQSRNLTVRLSGSLLTSTPDINVSGLHRRLEERAAAIGDYRAWFSLHAVTAKRQLFEILSHFWENHFVTQHSKSVNYLNGFGYDTATRGRLATDWEFREMTKWRNAMLNPQCTFYDLLKISAESPAMIVYLDTVNSRGQGNNIANENYARELLELFTFGVENGYDQNDIILMSRAWTGWSVELVDAANINNPLAPASITYYPNTNSTSKANTVGVWTFKFKSGNHGTNRGAIFAGRTVPPRFGPPWAGRNYQLNIPARTGALGIQDGYDVIAHLANQPFTQEYISIKLCRLFVHDDFPNPTTDPHLPEYAFYDYTDPNRSAEAELVRQCMLAWENSSPKGQLRPVLATIFNSELFRAHAAAGHKIKNPLEFVASAVRALRSENPDGTATANTDGFAFATPLARMGAMSLFNREDPDGYPEAGPSWISAGTLTERIRFVQSFCIAAGSTGHTGSQTGTGNDAGNNVCNPVALLKKKMPAASWNNAGAVADYFLGILYPGEGAGNLTLYREAAIRFLNTADNGTTTSLFSSLANTSTTYDTRVRGMVAMLMTFHRFQEQ